jgi:hypothetical protein
MGGGRAAGEDGGIRRQEILNQTHLTRSQFENGKVGIREHKAMDEKKCFIYDGDVYACTTDPGRCANALIHQLKMIDSQFRRMRTSAYGPLPPDVVSSNAELSYLETKVESMLADTKVMRETGYFATSKRLRQEARSK